ncbi:hypothetical protein, partial [Methylobacterium sp. GXF4]|uniref:hypothetical protein n=1 Tax=Methylobacterium sp. GXF4 TaxID=1096546 RepID=UPI001AEBF345
MASRRRRANPNASARLLMTALGADVNIAEQQGCAGISPSAFPVALLRSGRAAFGQHLPSRNARLNVSEGWISAGP